MSTRKKFLLTVVFIFLLLPVLIIYGYAQKEEKAGYKGIPWGIEFEEFEKIKSHIEKPEWKSNYFLQKGGG